MTADQGAAKHMRTARKASLTALVILSAFVGAGQYIFRIFGITLPAFDIADGIILLLIGLDMLEAKRSPTQEASGETEKAATKDDAGIVPMGKPMLAGPGAITSVRVLVGQRCPCCSSARRYRHLHSRTHHGMLLVALAVQDFVNGMVDRAY